MLWAQWTLVVLFVGSILLNMHEEAKRLTAPLVRPTIEPGRFVVLQCVRLLIVLVYVAAGAFDKIIGWPA